MTGDTPLVLSLPERSSWSWIRGDAYGGLSGRPKNRSPEEEALVQAKARLTRLLTQGLRNRYSSGVRVVTPSRREVAAARAAVQAAQARLDAARGRAPAPLAPAPLAPAPLAPAPLAEDSIFDEGGEWGDEAFDAQLGFFKKAGKKLRRAIKQVGKVALPIVASRFGVALPERQRGGRSTASAVSVPEPAQAAQTPSWLLPAVVLGAVLLMWRRR